jgi:stage V sporulation protein R
MAMYANTQLPQELSDAVYRLEEIARKAGLDFFPTIFELVDYAQLAEIASYGGFPTRYPHWKFGMEYDQLSKSYEYGLSIIYEMVINNNPCYAYLLRANSMVYQKTVIAHVYGHCDFFKNNFYFSKTNRKMLDQMANHATFVRRAINEIGQDEVETFLDVCLSLENLIDITAPYRMPTSQQKSDDGINAGKVGPASKLASKTYMDSYINPKEFLAAQQEKMVKEAERAKSFPENPERDVLKFLIDHAPLNGWQKRILEIVRDESYYFAPQGQTKILNEGWATYWHSMMMTKLAPLEGSEIVDYCDHYAGVVAASPGSINPYKIGVELLRHIESRWDRGQFGLEYMECDDPVKRRQWDTEAGLGRKKIFEVRKIHNDITFIDEFLDEDFCHKHKMFLYDFDRRTGRYHISSRDFKPIKQKLLGQLTNFGQPIISIVDANFRNRGELLLRHQHNGVDLKNDFAMECIKNLFKIWTRPVHLESIVEETPRRLSFDGKTHEIEKI